jgi:carboxymethylenebutenolidase
MPPVCYDDDATPPIYGPPVTRVTTTPLTLTSADRSTFAAFLARPELASGTGVLVLPDNGGLSSFFEQFTVRLAEQGHAALAIDYFGRTAGADVHGRDADFARMDKLMPHLAQLTKDGLDSDFAAAIDYLRSPGGASRDTVVSVGFCLGGRFAFLTAAAQFGLAAAIGLYGFPDELFGAPGPTQRAAELRAPILGMFGGGDETSHPRRSPPSIRP